jgi:ABC-type branched-subunit amino acid transport system ATPase component
MKAIFLLFSKYEKNKILILLFGIFIHGLIEITSIVSILPFMSVVLNPSITETNIILNNLYNFFNSNSHNNFLIILGSIVFLLLLISNIYAAFIFWWIAKFVQFQSYRLSKKIFNNYLAQPYIFFLNRNSSELSKNVLTEVNRVIIGVVYPILIGIARIAIVLFILILLLYVNPKLAATISLIFIVTYGIVYYLVREYLRSIGKLSTQATFEKYKFTNEAFSGIKDIKLRGTESEFIKKYSLPAKKFAKYSTISSVISLLPRYAIETMAFGGILLIVIYLISTNENFMSAIPLVALYALAGYRIMPGLQQVYHSIVQIRYNAPALDVLLRDLGKDLSLSKKSDSESNSLPKIKSIIQFKSVYFKYPNTDNIILENINIKIKTNSVTAFVGETGSGKTTLIDILLGLLPINKGEIFFDEIKLESDNLNSWQKKLGYVPQNIFLTDDTIKNNIAFAVPEDQIDHQKIVNVARLAELDDYISNLPDKYNTYVGERGIRISGGQMQRIGIARALYNNPEIIVFDEATSALDNVTEKNIMNSINKLAKDKTIIIIAHRLSTIKNCDQIYLLDRGKVSAQGSYDELIKNSKIFYDMVCANDGIND